ncbi:MAG: hypothetical protein HC836_11585 [Richelia sp. RM2_1_2]|nr:hypothetical protein [Richelia sp. SM2_1_7]NJM17474.1 hypothetical protein [Richelia sp. SM1_7_0]NJN06535.1 hypothetical protein [Richelia sp. RM1_1_1]NJO26257.1 hypothetical protein [Richelia sp. SL_2_1]NJO58949.1 hypothetical protein [Richelia sp. RM2_1_2]
MKNVISLGLLTLSIGLIPIIYDQKVLGKSELIVQQNNPENVNVSPDFGYIQTRNGRIAINTDKTYSIYNQDGKVVAENISLEELQAKHPELHEIIKDSIANENLMMDAGIGIGR